MKNKNIVLRRGVDFQTAKHAAYGRWPEIWAALDMGELPRMGKHGPCPGCGGKNRFRLLPNEIEDGGWICGQGGTPTGGDGFGLLIHTSIARNPGEALRLVADHLGLDTKLDPKARQAAKERALLAKAAQLEEALLHELLVLVIVLNNRVHDKAMPTGHWEREEQAARRIVQLIQKLYPARVLDHAA